MRIFFADHVAVPLPEGHRFPMPKYASLRARVELEGIVPPSHLLPAPPASDEQILLVHTSEYLNKLKEGRLTEKEIRRIGFPWSPQLLERSRRSVGATIATCRFALQEGIAANLGGGTHHAYPDHGEGFCVLNDVAIAARVMQAEGCAQRIVILDCDVHQGNGTAAIFKSDPSVFTFSIHGAKNFPFHKELSDIDVALPDGSGDDFFLAALRESVPQALRRARAELAIYIAGADPFLDDRFGRMSLTKQGLAERDRLVLELCYQAGLPVAIVMGGGYARRVEDIVDIHLQTLRIALKVFPCNFSPSVS